MKITLPLPPNMANSRMHWRVKHNKRKAYFEACDMVAVSNIWGQASEAVRTVAPSKARIRVTIYCGGLMDVDNALHRCKWSLDWLVRRKYLRGDSPREMEIEWPIEQVVKRNQQYRVEFELEAA